MTSRTSGACGCQRLTGQTVQPEVLVDKTFEFLLAREPGESIIRPFPPYGGRAMPGVRAGAQESSGQFAIGRGPSHAQSGDSPHIFAKVLRDITWTAKDVEPHSPTGPEGSVPYADCSRAWNPSGPSCSLRP